MGGDQKKLELNKRWDVKWKKIVGKKFSFQQQINIFFLDKFFRRYRMREVRYGFKRLGETD